MEITQIRNATVLIAVGPHRILVDPMLSRKDDLPTLRWLTRERRRNPIVELPPNSDALLASVTHCLITHCQKGHFDHLDTAGIRWLRAQKIPVVCMPGDADYLAKRRLNVAPLDDAAVSPFLGGTIRPTACTRLHRLHTVLAMSSTCYTPSASASWTCACCPLAAPTSALATVLAMSPTTSTMPGAQPAGA
jgi:L-ascorbate metabolism protein UlaG (beta-lactamase superfamily)